MSEPQTPAPQSVQIQPDFVVGPGRFVVMAGPCAVEDEAQILAAARGVAAAGAGMLRGGAYKPRTRPESFQGLGAEGLSLLATAAAATGLPVITEVLDPRQVDAVAEVASVLQVGSRNMQNFPLLREVGRSGKPVLIKRGAAATLDELMGALDYVLGEGNQRVLLCERGLRSFDPSTRYMLDLAAVPALRARTGLPVIVDPSHGTGRRELVAPMALAALAAGADGLLIEVHPDPSQARSDAAQALDLEDFSQLMAEIARWIQPSGRYLASPGTPSPDDSQTGERTKVTAP